MSACFQLLRSKLASPREHVTRWRAAIGADQRATAGLHGRGIVGKKGNHMCSERAKDASNKPVGLGQAAGDCYLIAAQGGSFSGNDQCLMRYDVADYYENANGNCQWQHNSKTVHGFEYGSDPPGTTLCWSGKGTGVNDTSNPKNKAGDASPGQGDCAHKFCLKNSAH